MRKLPFIVVICCTAAFVSCKGNDKKTDNQETAAEENKMENAASDAKSGDEGKNAKWEQRKSKGDTLALPYKDLQAYLPEISGYTKDGGPKGSQMNMPGIGSWSEAEQNYVSGDKRVSVKFLDYNSAMQMMEGLTAVYAMGFSSEDDSKKQNKLDLGKKDVAAYETIYKTDKRAELAIVVADRFFVTLNTNGDNSEEFLKDIAKSINLDKLAGL